MRFWSSYFNHFCCRSFKIENYCLVNNPLNLSAMHGGLEPTLSPSRIPSSKQLVYHCIPLYLLYILNVSTFTICFPKHFHCGLDMIAQHFNWLSIHDHISILSCNWITFSFFLDHILQIYCLALWKLRDGKKTKCRSIFWVYFHADIERYFNIDAITCSGVPMLHFVSFMCSCFLVGKPASL